MHPLRGVATTNQTSKMERGPLSCRANQFTGLYMITASVMKELKYLVMKVSYISFIIESAKIIQNYSRFSALRW